MTLTYDDSQTDALGAAMEWFEGVNKIKPRRCTVDHSGDKETGAVHTHGGHGIAPVLSIGGLAGSGKTTIVQAVIDNLGVTAVYAAPTHKAAAVLRGKLEDGAVVSTHHSLTYETRMRYYCETSGRDVRAVAHKCHVPEGELCEHPLKFERPCKEGVRHECPVEAEPLKSAIREHLSGHAQLIVMDETSMLSEQDVNDTRTLGVPILLVGDHGQLPPVKNVMNPWMRSPDVILTENHRQDEASGIIAAALEVRETGRLPVGRYGDSSEVVRINDPRMAALMSSGRFVPGPDRALIVPTNRLRARMNMAFHGEGPPREGDRVVALQRCLVYLVHNPGAGIAAALGGDEVWVFNGTTGTVRQTQVMGSGTAMVMMMVQEDDPAGDGRHFVFAAALEQFGRETKLKENERPRSAKLWDYAYAITAHKAQGSEFADVLVYGEPYNDYDRWMYTAITRARERLIVAVN